ncbi:MAG: GNAT family N-acetyltransferase [Pseudomonadales bacterium]
MTMQILPLADKKEFLWELAELQHAEWKHFSPSPTLQMRVDKITKAARREGIPSVYVAISGNQLLGSAAIVEQDMSTRPELSPWLAGVYIKEEFRNQGIASALIARCEREAALAGADTWYLFTEFASGLYEKLGWSHMERCDYKGVAVDVM